MPYPQEVKKHNNHFIIDKDINFVLKGNYSKDATAYFNRAIGRLTNRTATFFNKPAIQNTNSEKSIVVNITSKKDIKLGNDEAYKLMVNETTVEISGSEVGCYRGIETLLQLISSNENKYYISGVEVNDYPRFKWRGLMIDACRHWMPMEVIKRNIDAMATAKMNVFHWHLTEDQAFRIESKSYPKLHLLGNDGNYYTQEQVKEVVAYASARGIRVVPEFDIPGHATSWCVAYPETCSKDQEYKLETNYGIFHPTLNPSKEETYLFLDKFLTEMAALFPDEYLHIGGDENKGKHWNENTEITAFKKQKGFKDNHELQAYFNKRVLAILRKNGKKMIGWDEIFQPTLPKEIVIQSWRGKESLNEISKAGYPGILSNGYYLDMVYSAEKYYLNDPIEKNNTLTKKQQKLIWGGEATMWSELVSEETIDSRIWPVTLAIAERFWSSQNQNNVEEMYDRLDVVSPQLQEHGLNHLSFQKVIFDRLCNHQSYKNALLFVQLLEPLKGYDRHRHIKFKTYYPLSRLADACYTDSKEVRAFFKLIKSYKNDEIEKQVLLKTIEKYQIAAQEYITLAKKAPAMNEGLPMAKSFIACCKTTVLYLQNKANASKVSNAIEKAHKSKIDCELKVLEAFEYLVKN